MRYNMREIMKRAHELVKKVNVTLSSALKMSWVVAKKAIWIEEHNNLWGGELTWNIWVGYGHVRAYYRCNKWSRYQNEKKTNFVEL